MVLIHFMYGTITLFGVAFQQTSIMYSTIRHRLSETSRQRGYLTTPILQRLDLSLPIAPEPKFICAQQLHSKGLG